MQSGVSPSTLITVAVITAVSSLAASAVTALVAYFIAKRNLTHAAGMAELDRAAQLKQQQRTARRDAYAAYVTATLNTLRDTTMLRNRRESLESAEEWAKARGPARDSYNEMVIAQGVVKMEAPEPLAKEAEEVRICTQAYLRGIERFTTPGIEENVREEERIASRAAGNKAFAALNTFTNAARADLEG
ncbi:hypothetical protein [Streptomyces sp. RB13]|uniref:hypothetical protein n=1 Tax=Streptomyces sp. RB13 TaxID=2950978 RepID=UPI002FC661AF